MSINEHKDEQAMLKKISMQLDDSVERLDARTLSRLNVARQRALQGHQSSSHRLWTKSWLTGAVFASLFAAIAVGWMLQTTSTGMQDDGQFIASSEDLELIDELEFVTWLAQQDAG